MKNLKISKFYLALSLLATAFLSTSCEDLSPEDPNNYQRDEVTDANLFAVGMYQAYQKVIANEYLVTELRSDNTQTDTGLGALANIESYNLTPEFGDGSNYWANNYSVVLNANLIIEDEALLETTTEGQVSLAEAYFMRALCHYNLLRTFQNVPYINTVIEGTEDLKAFTQVAPASMINFIINDFNTSITYFNQSGENGPKNKANLGAAYGFLAKAYLSIPNNPDYGAAYSILSTHLHPDTNVFGYSLVDVDLVNTADGIDDYLSIFQGNELNEEILFAISFEETSSGPAVSSDINIDDQVELTSQNWSFEMTEIGPSNGINPTEDLLSLLLFDSGDINNTVVEPIRGGDRTVLEANDIDGSTAGRNYTGTFGFDTQQQAKFYDKKYRDLNQFRGIDAVVLRYADILLLFSEALLAGVDSQNIEAIEMYNRVRARVGAPELVADGTAFLTIDELLDERRRELTFENHRMWDLIRFGENKAIEVLSNFSADIGFNFDDTDLYLPIPRREITATGGEGVTYSQNAGY